MKRLFYLFVVFSCILAGCSKSSNHLDDPDDPDNPDYPTNVTLDIETKRYTIPQEGQQLGVKLETDMEYNVMIPDSVSSWVRLIETRAVRTDSLIFQISANTGAQDRSAQIVIKDKKSRLADTLHFIQYGKGKTYVGSVVFETEQDLIDFFEAGYIKVQGSVTVQGEELVTLQQLGNRLTEITDSLVLNCSSLTSLEGLSGLIKVSSFYISANSLKSFKGLENLEVIGRDFSLNASSYSSFSALESFEGLGSLKYIGGNFGLRGKSDSYTSFFDALESFEGLESLERIGGDFALSVSCSNTENKSSFKSLFSFKGLGNLKDIGGSFKLSSSYYGVNKTFALKSFNALVSFEGLENLQSVWHISIENCLLLSDFCSLENAIRNMKGNFKAKGNRYNPTKEMILNGQCSED